MAGNNYGISSLLIATDGSAYADVAAECSAWVGAIAESRLRAVQSIADYRKQDYSNFTTNQDSESR